LIAYQKSLKTFSNVLPGSEGPLKGKGKEDLGVEAITKQDN
jgi:hypothetical protein